MANNSGNSDQQLLQQQASFIQHSLPGLDPGAYQIEVQQTLQQSDGTLITGEGLPSITRKFGVAGARYSLDQNAVNTVYPPAGSVGEFSNSLAHVVLNTEKVPWLRSPYTPDDRPEPQVLSYTANVGGKTVTIDYDQDVPSWLGVVLLSPTDLNGADLNTVVQQGTVTDLVPATMQVANGSNASVPGTMPAAGYSIFSYLLENGGKPGPVDPGTGFTPSTVVRYIDLPCALFNAIVPSMGDLNMMAHIRAVQTANKPLNNGQIIQLTEQYGIVTGNRLPESQPAPVAGAPTPVPPLGSNLALLASFEAMEYALRGHSGQTYYDTQIATQPNGFVRLPVLFQWTFTSLQDTSFEFETILESLNGRDPNASGAVTVPNPQFRLPNPPSYNQPDNSQAVVQNMLESGYFPMNHLARIPDAQGQPISTLSWYRGPLAPFNAYVPAIQFLTGNNASTPAIFAADQLLRFDPVAGMYDVSYAMAWELGRLLSLQNKDFSVALYQWKKQVAQQYRALLDAQVLDDMYEDLMALYEEVSADENARPTLQKAALLHLQKISASR